MKVQGSFVSVDGHSYKTHLKTLRQEGQKKNPNRAAVDKLMALTFTQRRQIIEESDVPITEIIEENPFLGRKKQVTYLLLFH